MSAASSPPPVTPQPKAATPVVQLVAAPPDSGLRLYWNTYGRTRAIATSGYTWVSLVLAIVSLRLWLDEPGWVDLAGSILPNLLGFSLGGLAILVGIGDERFRRLLVRGPRSREGASTNIFMSSLAAVVHFVIVQAACLTLSVVARGLPLREIAALRAMDNRIGDALSVLVPLIHLGCTWLLYYALALVVAAALIILDLASGYARSQATSENLGKPPATP